MGLAPNFATVFVGDPIGCEVPDPIFSQPLSIVRQRVFGIVAGYEAYPRTWRILVTKVAARIIVSARRIRILHFCKLAECALPAPRCGGCGKLRASLKP